MDPAPHPDAPRQDHARRRRFPLRLTLGTVIVGLLLVVVAGILVAWVYVREHTRDATADALAGEVARGLASDIEDRLEAAEHTLSTLVTETVARRMREDDPMGVALRLCDLLRWDDRLEWVGFVTPQATGAYVLRHDDGSVLCVHRAVGGGVVEERVAPDGTRAPATSGLRDLAQLEEVPWYRVGAEATEPTWGALYERPVDHATGRACSVGVRREGVLVGVYGVGFSTRFASAAVARMWGDRPGDAAVFNPATGRIGISTSPRVEGELRPLIDRVCGDLPRGLDDLPPTGTRTWELPRGDDTWIVVLRRFHVARAPPAALAVLVPEHTLVAFFSRWRGVAFGAVGGLLVLAVAAALWISHRIAAPLKTIARDLERVGSFELSDAPPPSSRILEVSVVSDAAARMKRSLRSFSRYVPTELVRTLLRRGDEARLGGAVRRMTLLFSDVEGFTTVSERLAPQALVEALGAYLDVVVRAVTASGGTVDKFVGDAVVAFFNAPDPDPEHAAHACRAAVAVQTALAAARTGWVSAGTPAFPTRIGLHTAEVVVGNIGTPERFAYTVLGDGANLAARLEGLNKAYGTQVLASDDTRAAAGDGLEWRRVDRVAVAGRAAGTDVYELLGTTGAVAAPRLAARDAHEAGLAAYFARRFDEAARRFDEAAALRPDDRAAPTLAARARAFAAAPPPPSWDGVDVRAEK
ncbi:MAG: adenylate/guanylate cyclase domain-containing protein [Planctomycetes bacterium]|nr:adenylate/guanylate cyclase domain-containing protein [Planctomycetota bacterium]